MTDRKRVLKEFFQEEEIQYVTKIVETGLFLLGTANILLAVVIASMKGSQLNMGSVGLVAGFLLVALSLGLNKFRRWNQ